MRQLCPICERHVLVSNLTDHHVVPKSRGGKETVPICKACHRKIHRVFHNSSLEVEWNEVEKIKRHPEMYKYVKWIRKQSPDAMPKSKNNRVKV